VTEQKITVFYDGKCGLCSREIRYYQRIAPKGVFDWQDITVSANALNQQGITLAQGLKLLHVMDKQGVMHIGLDAFILMWRQIRGWKLLAMLVALPGIRQITDMAYRMFAERRFNRLKHCQLAVEVERKQT
jgi:predicted DCC family thiol-disulfide oxidoreductase YuxK